MGNLSQQTFDSLFAHFYSMRREAAKQQDYKVYRFADRGLFLLEQLVCELWLDGRATAKNSKLTHYHAATRLVKLVQSRGLIPVFPAPRKVMHYSNRGAGATDIVVREAIVRDISTGLVDKSGKDDRPY